MEGSDDNLQKIIGHFMAYTVLKFTLSGRIS